MARRAPTATRGRSQAASDVYKSQGTKMGTKRNRANVFTKAAAAEQFRRELALMRQWACKPHDVESAARDAGGVGEASGAGSAAHVGS